MNHFDEMECLLYLDGQMDESRARAVVTHTEECASCRKLLRAMERESELLTGSLKEDNEAMPARLLAHERWSVPSWVWTLAFGMFFAGVYWAWTDGISPWLDQLSSAGFGGTDLMSMMVFTGAFWEGWSEMMDILQIAALIVVVITALGLIRRHARRTAAIAVVLSAVLFAVALPRQASAAEVRRGQSVFIPAGETVHNDLIVMTSPSVRIDGTVEGDLIVFGRNVTVTGHVTGDVIAFAGQVLIDGTVDGNVRAIAHGITLQGPIGKNATTIANSLELSPKAEIGGGMIVIAGDAYLDGKIHRDVLGIVRAMTLDGFVGGQAWVRGQNLTVDPAAEIRGPATFVSRQQPLVASGAKLASAIQTEAPQRIERSRRSAARPVIRQIFSFAVALLVGLLLVVVFPGFFRTTLHETGSIGIPIGIGALALIAGLFLLVFGILLLFVGVGAGVAAVFAYAPILYVAQVFVGTWLGNKILGATPSITSAVIGRMALGLVILHLTALIPILGGLVWLAVLLWGSGAVMLGFYKMSRIEAAVLPA